MTDLIERYEARRTAHLVPAETAAPELGELATILRNRTRELVDLPSGSGLRQSTTRRGGHSTTTSEDSQAASW